MSNANGNPDRNAREELAAAAEWLGFIDEDFSMNLRSAEDGLKLWRYWQKRPTLQEFPDDESQCFYKSSSTGEYDIPELYGIERLTLRDHRIAAIGYDPTPEYVEEIETDVEGDDIS